MDTHACTLDENEPNVVILVGSPGSGKSTLGSFLIDPDNYYESPVFKSSSTHITETKVCSSYTCVLKAGDHNFDGSTWTFIDTPGPNEMDNIKDVEYMINVVDTVLKYRHVRAVILCYKFGGRLDKQFESTARFYGDLFRKYLVSNMFVVMTAVELNDYAEQRRKRDKVSLDKMCQEIQENVQKILSLPAIPTCAMIDAFPRPHPIELEPAKNKRIQILGKIFSCSLVPTSNMEFRKTEGMQSKDTLKVKVRQFIQFILFL
jgi:predicted GTPase